MHRFISCNTVNERTESRAVELDPVSVKLVSVWMARQNHVINNLHFRLRHRLLLSEHARNCEKQRMLRADSLGFVW